MGDYSVEIKRWLSIIIKDLHQTYNRNNFMQARIKEQKQIQGELQELQNQEHTKLEINQGVDSQYEEQERQIEETQQVVNKDSVWIRDPHQYLEYCMNNKKIKVMDEQNPIFKNVYLKDISLHYKGPMEDKAYSNNYAYYMNIRRGNTLCQIYHNNHYSIDQKNQLTSTQSTVQSQANKKKNEDEYELFFCRRGMKKFYDLQPQYLSTQHQQKLTIQHKKYRRRIFQSIDAINYEHSQIHLYSIFKQNGQHCQITYIKKLQTWLFASKNVSILIRDQIDLQNHYQKIRFYWAKLIATQFLSMLKSLSKSKIQQLKQQLNTKTLLGQHCGHQNHQHITKYDQVQIIFYAIVQKNTQDHCLPVQYCKNFLQKYSFKMSKIKSITNLKDKNSTYQAIYTLLKSTAQGTMEQYGQGSVLYVVQQKGKTQRTISMCKLKTCEYLIFRRLREMLKLNVERKSTANTFQKFKFDIQNLIAHYFSPPQPLESYLSLAKQAFKQAGQNANINESYLRYKFVEFIQKISTTKESSHEVEIFSKKVLVICLPRFTNTLEKYAKSNSIPFQYMYRNLPPNSKDKQKKSGSLHILYMIPRLPEKPEELQNLEIFICEYNPNQLEQIQTNLRNCKDLTKSHLITFVKSQNKKKSLQLLNQKMQLFKETLKNKDIKFTLISQAMKNKDQEIISKLEQMRKSKRQFSIIQPQSEQKQKGQSTKYKHFIIYPMLLPGSGKSTLREQLEKLSKQNGYDFESISGDQIRSKLMSQNLNEKGVNFDLESQYFNETFAEVKEKANQKLRSVLEQKIQNHLQVQRDTILFVDKIYGSESIQGEIESISKHKNIIPIVLIAQSSEVKLKCFTLPFSLQYLLICLKRCIQRQEHSTMTRRPEEICNIFVWFLKMYGNLSPRKLQQTLQKMNSQTQLLRVETVEQSEGGVSMILRKKLEQCIYSNRSSEKSIQLIEQMYKNMDVYLKDIYAEERKDSAARQIIQRLKQK